MAEKNSHTRLNDMKMAPLSFVIQKFEEKYQ